MQNRCRMNRAIDPLLLVNGPLAATMGSRSLSDGSKGLNSAGRSVGDRRTGAPRGEGAVLLQHGQNLYQQGNFSAAVEAFTEVCLVLCISGKLETK